MHAKERWRPPEMLDPRGTAPGRLPGRAKFGDVSDLEDLRNQSLQLGKEKQAAKYNSESLRKHQIHTLLAKNLAFDKLNKLSVSYVPRGNPPRPNY